MRIVVLHRDDKMKEKYPHDFEGRIESKDTLNVMEALAELGHKVIPVCTSAKAVLTIKRLKPDIVFNLCDDGLDSNSLLEPHVAAMLEAIGVPYTGNDYLALGLCLNKAKTKQILQQNCIKVARYQLFENAKEKLSSELRFPMIVKPAHEDGSIGIRQSSVVDNYSELKKQVEFVLKEYKQPALVEEFIEGREFNVSMVGNENIEVFPVIEMCFEKMPVGLRHIYSYESKWVENNVCYQTTYNKYPANIDAATAKKISDIAVKAYKVMGCSGYGRVEFRMRGNELFVIEVNPNTDMENKAELYNSATLLNWTYKDLVDKIVKLGLEKFEKKEEKREQIALSVKRKAGNLDNQKRNQIA